MPSARPDETLNSCERTKLMLHAYVVEVLLRISFCINAFHHYWIQLGYIQQQAAGTAKKEISVSKDTSWRTLRLSCRNLAELLRREALLNVPHDPSGAMIAVARPKPEQPIACETQPWNLWNHRASVNIFDVVVTQRYPVCR